MGVPLGRTSVVLILGLLLAGSLLAGCITPEDALDPASAGPGDAASPGDNVTTRLHEVAEMRSFEVAAEDGTMLRGHVYIPDGEGPFATILVYNPYDNFALFAGTDEKAREDGDRTTLVSPYDRFLESGYALAFVNLRGTGISDGCPTWFEPTTDGKDAAQVIGAIAERPWSDGTVGMIGISWYGYSQYAALYEQPEALKAVAPASAIIDLWSLWTRHGAAINTQFGPRVTTFAAFWAVTTAGPGDEPRHVDCPGIVEKARAANGLSVDGDKTPFFEEREMAPILARNEVPMLVSNGLSKLQEGHILQIDGLWPLMNERSRLLIGQWGHAYPQSTPSGADYWDEVLAWMDFHVRGLGPAPPMGVVDYEDRGGTWHRADVWPPAGDTVRLHLTDGAITPDEDDVSVSRQVLQPTGTDPSPDTCPGDKAVYVSPPLAEDVLLAGNFRTNLTLTSTGPDANLGVFLWHLDDLLLCASPSAELQPIAYPHEVSRALSDLAHRGHLEVGEPFPVGSPESLSLQSHPYATPVRAGERLVLAVTGGAVELEPTGQRPQLVVHTGDGAEAWIDLVVVDGELRFAEEA